MIITKLKRIGNSNRFHVYADEAWVGIFLDEMIVKYQIKVNASFDDDEFSQIKCENDERVAFDMAVGYIEKYVVSEKGLKDYLKKKGFNVSTISKAVEKLNEYGLIDDERFAKNYFESLSGSRGKRAISQKLKQKGVSDEIINELLESVEEEDEIEKATAIAEKFVRNRQKDTKIKQKCLAHLIYKGYDYSVAQKATNEVLKDAGDENDWF